MINFLKGVSVVTGQVGGAEGAGRDELWVAPPNTTVSSLTIRATLRDHAGNYTCAPPHATSDTVRLYVANGEHTHSTVICVQYLGYYLMKATRAGGDN